MNYSRFDPTNIRFLFYGITPKEFTIDTFADVPNYIDLVFLVVEYYLSHFYQAVPSMVVLVILEFLIVDRKKYAFNDTITSINSGMFSLLAKYAKKTIFCQKMMTLIRYGGKTISAFIYSSIYPHVKLLDLDPQSINTFVLCFLAADFSYYLGH